MSFVEQISNDRYEILADISEYTMRNNTPVYIWGSGSVAVGVVDRLRRGGIKISGLFVNVSPYNVDKRIDPTIPIFTLQELEQKNTLFSVVVGHACYELINDIRKNPIIDRIWVFTDIVRNDISINHEFIKYNEKSLEYTYSMLADNLSRDNFVAYLNAKVTGNIQYIWDVFAKPVSFFDNDVVNLNSSENYLDIGAYDGKSIDEFIASGIDQYTVVAVEVLPEMCEILIRKYSNNPNVNICHVGCSDHNGIDSFTISDQSTGLCESGDAVMLSVKTVDELLLETGNNRITIVKICIGNSINKILFGAKETIANNNPRLIISAGIDRNALVDYVRIVEEITGKNNSYRYYMRFNHATADALVLYAIPTKK